MIIVHVTVMLLLAPEGKKLRCCIHVQVRTLYMYYMYSSYMYSSYMYMYMCRLVCVTEVTAFWYYVFVCI